MYKAGEKNVLLSHYMYVAFIIILILLLSICKNESFADNQPTITITPRTETANIGDTVVFDYSITGLEEYRSITANVVVWTNKIYNEAQIEGVQVEGGLTGTISTKI